MIALRTVLLVLALPLAGCNSVDTRAKPTADTGTLPAVLTVDDAIARAATLDGKEVALQGRYMGWKGRCTGMPPNRSAWMLEGETGCIYVTGPLPQGVAPAPSEKDLGRDTRLHGTLLRDRADRPYLVVR